MILNSDPASTAVNIDLFQKVLLEDPGLLDSIWPWTKLQASASVLKGSSDDMAPDMSRLLHHPHRRYAASDAIYSYFESAESRECTATLMSIPHRFSMCSSVLLERNRATSCLLFPALLAGRDRDIPPFETCFQSRLERWFDFLSHKMLPDKFWRLRANSLEKNAGNAGPSRACFVTANKCAASHAF